MSDDNTITNGTNDARLTMNDYQKAAMRTAMYPSPFMMLAEGKSVRVPWAYPALKLAGETGEVAEKLGKIIRDQNGVMTDEQRVQGGLNLNMFLNGSDLANRSDLMSIQIDCSQYIINARFVRLSSGPSGSAQYVALPSPSVYIGVTPSRTIRAEYDFIYAIGGADRVFGPTDKLCAIIDINSATPTEVDVIMRFRHRTVDRCGAT